MLANQSFLIIDMARSSTFFTAILWLLGHSILCLVTIIQLIVTHLMSSFEVYILLFHHFNWFCLCLSFTRIRGQYSFYIARFVYIYSMVSNSKLCCPRRGRNHFWGSACSCTRISGRTCSSMWDRGKNHRDVHRFFQVHLL